MDCTMDIVTFSKVFDRTGFDCGQQVLNDWLQRYAGQQDQTNNTRTFLAVDESGILGYYASTTYRLALDEVATMYGAGKRAYPIPAVLLARLAVDRRSQGAGVGARLLTHALTGFARASLAVGFEVVVVHAIDDSAVTFYARFGFQQFQDEPRHLFLTTKDLRATLA